MRRLRTWIRDDEAMLKAAMDSLRPDSPDLAYEIQRRLRTRAIMHIQIEKQLKEVEGFYGYTGLKTCGVGRYSPPSPPSNDDPAASPVAAPSEPAQEDTQAADAEDDNDSQHELDDADQVELDRMTTV